MLIPTRNSKCLLHIHLSQCHCSQAPWPQLPHLGPLWKNFPCVSDLWWVITRPRSTNSAAKSTTTEDNWKNNNDKALRHILLKIEMHLAEKWQSADTTRRSGRVWRSSSPPRPPFPPSMWSSRQWWIPLFQRTTIPFLPLLNLLTILLVLSNICKYVWYTCECSSDDYSH